ncbi:DUF1853 family protein [Microbulbifer sp. ARAS458-1]|uniref:DUF1853 family protein n=1 Tax=Microbulbifer sp. ARAS458-1 TaxID=3140242 RepID=UPI0038779597
MSSPGPRNRPAALPTRTPNHWHNFLWALGAPDIAPNFSLPWLPPHRHQALTQFFSRPEIKTQLEPALLAQLEQHNSHRLGIYFERLWAFAFTHHPDYALEANNLPIRDQGRTLGELDFVVHYKPDDVLEHWEVALKFYLQVDNDWVGPGLRDRLAIKLARMRDHQLPIAHSAIASAWLDTSGLSIDRQWAVMPGRLFHPLSPAESPQTRRFWWADLASFHTRLSGQGDWWLLPKTCWLASAEPEQPPPSFPVAEAHLTRGPICVAAVNHHGELSRGFLVPSDWLTRARHGT